MSYCNWSACEQLLINYHDAEWGVPLFDDIKQFEFLMMEVMQCGLSWTLVMKKREILRKCFDEFDFKKIAQYTEEDVERILSVDGMIRSRRKILAVINNANRFLEIAREFGSYCNYIWSFSNGKTILYENHADGYIPVSNGLSDDISRDLKKRGFKFLGSVTVYSYLQSCGVINDHGKDCPCYGRINGINETVNLPADRECRVKKY